MKKRIKIALIVISIFLIGLATMWFGFLINPFFFVGNKYDSSKLDNMELIYENQSDIHSWNEGYSTSDSAPWGFEHKGLDFFFKNNSKVIACAPGRVEFIHKTDHGEDTENRYRVAVKIRFNYNTVVNYNFEPWANTTEEWTHQQNLLIVSIGDWVEPGDEIGRFLAVKDSAHVHFTTSIGWKEPCPSELLSDSAEADLLNLVHSYHPDWDLCYI